MRRAWSALILTCLWASLALGAIRGPVITFPPGSDSSGTPIPDLTCNTEDGFACLVGQVIPLGISPTPRLLVGEPAPGDCTHEKDMMTLPVAGGIRLWACEEALGTPLEVGGRPGINQITDEVGAARTIAADAPDGTLHFVGCVVSGTAPNIVVTCHSETAGSGAANTLPLWAADNLLTDSLLSQSGGNVFLASGDLRFTGTTSDIGTSGASRPRTGYYSTSLRVGTDIGSGSAALLAVKSNTTLSGVFVNTTTPGASAGAGMIGATGATPSAADQRLGFLLFASNPTGATFRFGAGVQAFTAGAWTDNVAHPAYLSFSTVDLASTTRTERWQIRESGHLWPVANNTYDIGSDALRSRNVYAGTAVIAPAYTVGATPGATGTCGSVGVVNGIVTVCTP